MYIGIITLIFPRGQRNVINIEYRTIVISIHLSSDNVIQTFVQTFPLFSEEGRRILAIIILKKKERQAVEFSVPENRYARYRGRIEACLVIKRKSRRKKACLFFHTHTHANKYTGDGEMVQKKRKHDEGMHSAWFSRKTACRTSASHADFIFGIHLSFSLFLWWSLDLSKIATASSGRNSYGSRAKQATVPSQPWCCTIYILIKIKSPEKTRTGTRLTAIKKKDFSLGGKSNLHNKFTWLCNSCVLTTVALRDYIIFISNHNLLIIYFTF